MSHLFARVQSDCVITVSELPDIRPVEPKVVATVGSPAMLECQYEEMLSQEMQWTKDGYPIMKSNRVHVDDNTLSFSAVASTDSGLYQCWADNEVGSSYAILRLTVKQAGKLSERAR